jgi:hypothetical protein
VVAATFAFLDDLHLEVRGAQRTLRRCRNTVGKLTADA